MPVKFSDPPPRMKHPLTTSQQNVLLRFERMRQSFEALILENPERSHDWVLVGTAPTASRFDYWRTAKAQIIKIYGSWPFGDDDRYETLFRNRSLFVRLTPDAEPDRKFLPDSDTLWMSKRDRAKALGRKDPPRRGMD